MKRPESTGAPTSFQFSVTTPLGQKPLPHHPQTLDLQCNLYPAQWAGQDWVNCSGHHQQLHEDMSARLLLCSRPWSAEYSKVVHVTTDSDVYSFGMCELLKSQRNSELSYICQEPINSAIRLLEDPLQQEFIQEGLELQTSK